MNLTAPRIYSRKNKCEPPLGPDGYRLTAEERWVVEGHEDQLREIQKALPERVCEKVGHLLLLDFLNAVGQFELPHLGRLCIASGKWEELHFEAMLDQLALVEARLPFGFGTGGGLPYDRRLAERKDVLYHMFVYLRHVFSSATPLENQLLPALQLVLREPHRRFEQIWRSVPLHQVRNVQPRGLYGIVSGKHDLRKLGMGDAGAVHLATALLGYLPEEIEESAVRNTFDVPENRFVKAFLNQISAIVDATRRLAETSKDRSFTRRLNQDCDVMDRRLRPVVNHRFWDDVGTMHRLPADSTVIQQRRGYREIFRHFTMMRLAARLPLSAESVKNLLELKDIAELYELWCFYRVVSTVTDVTGHSPTSAETPVPTPAQVRIPRGLRVEWPGGIEVCYNAAFSRSQADIERTSYSLLLRPDIALRIPSGPQEGFHLLDAKFRLRTLPHPDDEDSSEEEEAAERRGSFKRADLYKMHTYRDAIPSARSVWILYPGTEMAFFGASEKTPVLRHVGDLPDECDGVGAIPLLPAQTEAPELRGVLQWLLQQ